MKLPLAYYGDAILRKKTSPVDKIDDEIRQLIENMIETMEENDGCGLAAPQVHHSLSLFITQIPVFLEDDKSEPGILKVFINPKIVSYSQETWACEEGCLSIPKLKGNVVRPLKITIQATNLEGNTFTEEFIGFDAHVIMHENDHINGVLYIDRLSPQEKKRMEPLLKDIKKKYSSSK
jgi:peptide deformylase